jgi:hypothetical protein
MNAADLIRLLAEDDGSIAEAISEALLRRDRARGNYPTIRR